MTDQNAQKKTTEARPFSANQADFGLPFQSAFGLFQKEALKVADDTEKLVDRSMQEMKRANHETARLWEAQLELGASMSRAMFDGVRRVWNV